MGYIELERVEDSPHPDYCSHMKAPCSACGKPCWLGNKTRDLILGGVHRPLCHRCAKRYDR